MRTLFDMKLHAVNSSVAALALVWALVLPGCAGVDVEDGTTRPEPASDLSVMASADPPAVSEGVAVVFSAVASGGSPPYLFRWDQNSGPARVDLPADVTSAALEIDSLSPAGRYVFRVTVADSGGSHASDYVPVEVGPAVSAVASADAMEIVEGETATLSAAVTDGTAPFTYRWALESGPADVTLADADMAEITTPPLTSPGEYVFSLTVTDFNGFEAEDNLTIVVIPLLSTSVPPCAILEVPVTLAARPARPEGAEVLWEVVEGNATVDDAAALATSLTVQGEDLVVLRLTAELSNAGVELETRTLEFVIEAVDGLHPRVMIETNFGAFTLELDGSAAPLHVENFLAYVDEGFYEGLLFHRSAKSIDGTTGASVPFVLQGGGYRRVDGELELQVPARDPVPSEAGNGLTNGEGYSISLALSATPDTGSAQFFINLDDNGFLDEQEFTVFGRVIEGTDAVDAIAALETVDSPVLPGEVSLPAEDVIMERITRACE